MNEYGIELSVVTPIHNEEFCIREFHRRVTTVLKDMSIGYELVVVNDGSTDSTPLILRELAQVDPHLLCVFLAHNSGQCTAIYAGLQHTKGRYVVIMDGDLQHPPEELPTLLEKAKKGFDMVKGARINRSESLVLRRIPSRIANYLLRIVSRCEVRDMGGFSLLKGDLARSLILREGQHRILPALIYSMGGSIAEVSTSAPPRFAGKSHYNLSRSIDVLLDILLLWLQNSFKQRPIYLFGRIAIVLFLTASLIMVWLLYKFFFCSGYTGSRLPLLEAILFYLASLGFLSTGFILESISKILDIKSSAKPYQVLEIVGQTLDSSKQTTE